MAKTFWGASIRDEADYQTHIDYLHINPVKHGFVKQVKDWPHSTFHHLVAQGIYPIDWGGGIEKRFTIYRLNLLVGRQ